MFRFGCPVVAVGRPVRRWVSGMPLAEDQTAKECALLLLRSSRSFNLKDEFVAKYADLPAPFGYDGLGELVFLRTYAR